MPDIQPAAAGQLFNTTTPTLRYLIEAIKNGDLGLPDIQRAFVWKNAQVRDLFDSLYRGYPVGILLLWETGADGSLKVIGTETNQVAPKLAIVDGQQRLTSLFAVIEGREVLRVGHAHETIRIAFNPLTAEFKVTDAAVVNDPAFITDISSLLSANASIFDAADTWAARLTAARETTADEIATGKRAIQRLSLVPSYTFTVFQLPAKTSPEIVSEIFVRINSKGKKLNQADFLLTMMSVYWDDGRKQLEEFCARAASGNEPPANPYIQPLPDQMLRVTVGLGFNRAKLAAMHAVLRGHAASDAGTGPVDQTAINAQFSIMSKAQDAVLNLNNWTAFQKCLLAAGYRDDRLISSQISIIATYLHWIIGRVKFKIDESYLRAPIARWFFMAAVTARYTSSFESQLERELKLLEGLSTQQEWLATMNRVCSETLTPDFWRVTLPNQLATSAGRSPTKFAFYAAQNLLGARALYSELKISDLLDPAFNGPRAALEAHHIFPKAYLKSIGVDDPSDRNQIANYTFAEWLDNADIAGQAPADYAPAKMQDLGGAQIKEMHRLHALPERWWLLPYPEFLQKRRELMAGVIQAAYDKLSGVVPETAGVGLTVEELITAGESEIVEYKSTLRVALHTGAPDPRMELDILRTIAGFLNARGGTLLIGVADSGQALGLENDGFPNEDKMALHLVTMVRQRMGNDVMPFVHLKFEEFKTKKVLSVKCESGHRPVFVKDDKHERFYVRSGPSTAELPPSDQHKYITARFG